MNLNKVFVLGNLTADPIVRALPSGQSVVNFGLATNRIFYDKDRQKQQQTEFHNIVAFGRNAEIVQQYLRKGSMVLIEGRIQTRNWEDSSGNKRYRTEIITERLQLGPRNISQTASPVFPSEPRTQTRPQPEQPKPQTLPEASSEEIPVIEEKKPPADPSPQLTSSEDSQEEEIDVKDIPF